MSVNFPQRIVCMTEESVETIYALGLEERIVGVSSYVRRPPEAMKKQKISVFTHAQQEKIKSLHPDLVLGFSDIQKDIAKDLIGMGLNVWIANHRSLNEIFNYIVALGGMLGAGPQAIKYADKLKFKLDDARQSIDTNFIRPKVYIEEWDEPQICGIRWFSELVEACGGIDIFSDKSKQSMGKDRILEHEDVMKHNPDIMLACWCGKPVKMESIYARQGYEALNFIKNKQIHELEPEIFLQPGPAPFESGIKILKDIFAAYQKHAESD